MNEGPTPLTADHKRGERSVPERTVAVLDILGFKEMVKEIPLAALSTRFQMLFDKAMPGLTRSLMQPLEGTRLVADGETRKSWCLRYNFSDTIVLISDDQTEEACLRLLLYTFRTLQYLTVTGLYARGGVSFGEMLVDLDRQVFLGKALVEAHELEQSQDWIGCTIHESVEKKFSQIFEKPPILNNLFPRYLVPMKVGPVNEMRTINWRWYLQVQGGTRSLFKPTSNWPERRKVENTLAYAKFIRSSGRAYPRDNNYPVELHVAFVGHGPPPPNALPSYPHGDEL